MTHGDDADLGRAGGGEGGFEFGQVGAFGNKRRKPAAESRAGGAFRDHAAEEGGFAALAPEFVGLAAEVERGLAGGAVASPGGEVAELARGAGGGFGGGSVEGRVAEGGGKGLAGRGDILEHGAGRGLMAEFDVVGDGGVCGGEAAGPVERGGGDVGTDEAPAVFARAEQRVNGVGPDADVEDANRRAARDGVVGGGFREQVGEVMEVVGAAGDGRAERAGREFVADYFIVVGEQGAVEREHGGGVGKVDRVALDRMRHEEARECGERGDEGGEIVAPVVVAAGMQAGGRRGRGGGTGHAACA